jgi:SAM-dependent methyltransferase
VLVSAAMVHCLRLIDRAWLRSERCVLPERLDVLPVDDPMAQRSRRDLQRVHRAMRSLSILRRATTKLAMRQHPRRILELGSGDGSLLLRFARAQRPPWPSVEVTFLDRQDVVSPSTKAAFGDVGWNVNVLCVDALEWARSAPGPRYDLCVTTLFLHHFSNTDLSILLAGVAACADAFLACEPRRNTLSRFGSHLIGLLGANEVTKEDGITSVAAGFTAKELTSYWPLHHQSWDLDEYFEWPFTHCLIARRSSSSHAAA